MLSAGITGIFALTAWMKIISDKSWSMAKGGDGVVVDILTMTFIHDYMKRTKKLFKTYFLLSNITCCVLIQVLEFTYKIHGVKGFSVEGMILHPELFYALVAVSVALTAMVIKFGVRLWFADKEVISQY